MTRREFMATLPVGVAATASAFAQRDASKITITGLEIFPFMLTIEATGFWSGSARTKD
jgi:hypothetical protein